MIWLYISLFAAVAASSQEAWVKKFFSHLSPYEMAAYPLIYSLPMFAITLPFIPVPKLDATFFWYFLVSIPLNAVAFVLHTKAIKISPLSLTIPYLAFTPAFMIFTGYVFLDEIPNTWGVLGIMIICLGSYVLNMVPGKWSPLSPLKAVFDETGAWMMLIAAFLYSFAAVIGKKCILHSSPLFSTVSFFAMFNLFFVLFLLRIRKIRLTTFMENPVGGVITGGLLFVHALLHGWAISLTKAAYMMSVKRISIVFGVIWGKVLFKEQNIAFRIGGTLMMLAGTLFITLLG